MEEAGSVPRGRGASCRVAEERADAVERLVGGGARGDERLEGDPAEALESLTEKIKEML